MRHWTLPVFILLGWAALLVAPAPASAQNYNPETGGNLIQGVTINAAGSGQLNDQNTSIGTIGVEDCRSLIDRDDPRVSFSFQINPRYRQIRGDIQYDDALLLEFPEADGFSGSCNRSDTDGCRRLESGQSTIQLTPEPQEQIVRADQIEVQIGFDDLLEYEDDQAEACAFAAPSNATSAPRVPLQSDGGLADVNGGTGGDTGTTDTSVDADTGTGVTADGDRVYAARIFLTGLLRRIGSNEEQKVADAALLLDLTRPPKPSNLRADATENKIVVKFDAPSQTSEVESYHVFHSTSEFQSPGQPEKLDDREGVRRRLLSGTVEEDGTVDGDATGIDRNAGEDLYIAVASRDAAGNFSLLAQRGSPVVTKETQNFPYDGAETGGCSCSTGTALPTGLLVFLAGLGALGWSLRRRDETNR